MGSISENAGDVIEYIKQFFNDMGGTCSELLSSALNLYKRMLLSAVELLSKDYQGTVGTNTYTHSVEHYGEFKDFWTVINNVSNIFAAIATTLITLLFLISLVNDSWDNRHELDFASFFKSFAKFFAAIVLVNNATKIVSTLFTLSSKVAALICSTNNLEDLDVSLKVADEQLIRYGVSGPKGLIISILFLMVFLVIIASGITVMLEVYQRMFKIFVLIPFSAISFSTFTMSDSHRGAEVFHGYAKSIISTAIESVIIMVFIAFSLTLINGDGLDSVFSSDNTVLYETYTANSQSDVLYLKYCKKAKKFSDDQVGVMKNLEIDEDAEWQSVKSDAITKSTIGYVVKGYTSLTGNKILGFIGSSLSGSLTGDSVEEVTDTVINRSSKKQREALASDGAVSDGLLNQLSSHTSKSTSVQSTVMNSFKSGEKLTAEDIKKSFKDNNVVRDSDVSAVIVNGFEIDELDIENLSVSEESPVTVYVYGQIGFFDILVVVFKYIFPCLLCGSAVKMAGQISGMILGR